MVAVGLIAILVSLLLPVMAQTREAANSAKCASNLRQMGVALTMYLAQNGGRAPDNMWHSPSSPEVAWDGYWLGILDARGVKDNVLLCPSAADPTGIPAAMGYGTATHCWTGQFAIYGSVVRFSDTTWRNGSYGYNRYLTAGGFAGPTASIAALRDSSQTPAFFDCVYEDAMPPNGSPAAPPPQPPDLTGGQVGPGSPEDWKFLITRHGRGINVCMADGSVSWVPLEQTYVLSWKNDWTKYPLNLPPR